ncbi:alpha/beta fold hydrolase [Shewanella surugensis]|uniref:Alpha/beta hydrolase n=1 Tax=Shewanella surugensis TaxID=212020 RepID=A0ABT0LJ58_9GAMM|nr:alpha/beta hydrolase [Shewanella surugensis]MCL1127161.1 alpha/beta hydrolase [Shewanella surugensis]
MRCNHLVLPTCLLFILPSFAIASWFEEAKVNVQALASGLMTPDSNEIEIAKAQPFPTQMLGQSAANKDNVQGRYSYFIESIFHSQMLVFETGLAHPQSLLLVHGLGQLGMQDWQDVVPELAKHYHIIAIDLPGFGLSGIPDGRYSPTHYAQVLDEVIARYAKDSVIVMGHSMGGAVSLRFAAMYPNKLERLILVDAAGILEKTAFIKHISGLSIDDMGQNEVSEPSVATENTPSFALPEVLQTKWVQMKDLSGSLIEMGSLNVRATDFLQHSDLSWDLLVAPTPNLNAALSLVEEDFSEEISQLKVPTHVIWGAEDQVAPLRTAKVLRARLPDVSVQIIDHAGHVPMKSHTDAFLSGFEAALSDSTDFHITETHVAEKRWDQFNANTASIDHSAILVCDHENNKSYSGHFKTVNINACSNIQLKNMTTDTLIITDSLVAIENLMIHGSELALKATESVITITNANIHADKGLLLSGSRLDLAGVSINAQGFAIKAEVHSQVLMSVSDIKSVHYQGWAQGGFELEGQTLSSVLLAR